MDGVGLICYIHAARRKYLKVIGELPWEEVVEDRGATFASIRNIFLHPLYYEDRYVSEVIPGKVEKGTHLDYDTFVNVHSIKQQVDAVEDKGEGYLASLEQVELERTVTVARYRDPPLTMRAEDILVDVAIEVTSHMEELIAILWQVDKRPPFLSWFRFLERGS